MLLKFQVKWRNFISAQTLCNNDISESFKFPCMEDLRSFFCKFKNWDWTHNCLFRLKGEPRLKIKESRNLTTLERYEHALSNRNKVGGIKQKTWYPTKQLTNAVTFNESQFIFYWYLILFRSVVRHWLGTSFDRWTRYYIVRYQIYWTLRYVLRGSK